ncbi:hypothetical protein OSB04_004742 [Centaurea solstitialis]|uniref:Peptidase C1A papain C-terminal domain-containing protein n=1 Tax=Centaurea solstitialis TaxID=347529 RepID=A0AA38WFR0_9ASTR|nr:hypothetical protein OSB04_004742 [Centaurea solstitialis]
MVESTRLEILKVLETACAGEVIFEVKLQNRVVQVAGFADVPIDDEQLLMEAVAQQLVYVVLAGLYTGDDCVENGPNLHAINLVGWGTTPEGCKYWILKNSWGQDWGEKGYMRIARQTADPKGACFLTQQTCYPVLDQPPGA